MTTEMLRVENLPGSNVVGDSLEVGAAAGEKDAEVFHEYLRMIKPCSRLVSAPSRCRLRALRFRFTIALRVSLQRQPEP